MNEKEIKDLVTCVMFLFCICLIGALVFAYNMVEKIQELEDDIDYVKTHYSVLYQDVKTLEYKNKQLTEEVQSATEHVDNVVWNILENNW